MTSRLPNRREKDKDKEGLREDGKNGREASTGEDGDRNLEEWTKKFGLESDVST